MNLVRRGDEYKELFHQLFLDVRYSGWNWSVRYGKKNDHLTKVYSFTVGKTKLYVFNRNYFILSVCVFILLEKMTFEDELNLLNNL